MPNYFICTYGNFEREDSFLRDSLKNNYYLLHEAARYPYAIDNIQKGDILLLKNYSWIVAWGYAKGSVYNNNAENGWTYVVEVEKWHSYDDNDLAAGFYAYGVSWATIQGGQMSVVKQVEEEWAKQQLEKFQNNKDLEKINLISDEVTCYTLSLKDLFDQNLTIPTYQRGYCWRKENIIKFLDTMYFELQKHISKNEKTENTDSPPYHLGTIILKNNGTSFDIIDGQQRLTTLSILLYCLGNSTLLITKDISKTENISEEHIGYIIRAKRTIKEWLEINKIDPVKLLSSICICLITIPQKESEDLAYRFFNATNATGKRLSDYDLLKNHHLRHVPNSQAGFVASKWNTMQEEEQKNLLNHTLFRLRNWSYGNTFDLMPDAYTKRLIFEHYSVKYDPIKNMYSIPLTPQYNSIFSGGLDFFGFVESNKVQYRIFEEIDCIKKLDQYLSWHSNGVLCSGIKAISFLFYMKYGEIYLSEALFCIALRVSSLRNEGRVQKNYLAKGYPFKELVQMIDISTSPNIFFAYCLSPEFQYVQKDDSPIKKRYWEALGNLFTEVCSRSDFQLKSQYQIYLENKKNAQ